MSNKKILLTINYNANDKNMICPTCQTSFHPHMSNLFIGKNGRNNNVFIYYQICPECREPIVGLKESLKGEVYLNPNDVEGLVIFTNQRRK